MIGILLLVLLFFVLVQSSSQDRGDEVSILGYKTKYFHISDGASKRMYENMKKDGLSPESLQKFIHMEDRFLKLEHISACSGISKRIEGYGLCDQIKEAFQAYDFSYHATHLKQMAEPHKVINRSITC
jgi:hypothetical protein|tara:strand:+ start:3820 stop:4203 length:384 start_codon:yes stop_codon:yes gene_type:complete